MALLFDATSDTYLAHNAPILTEEPMTIAAWVRSDADVTSTIVGIVRTDGVPGVWFCGYRLVMHRVSTDGTKRGCAMSEHRYPSYSNGQAFTITNWSVGQTVHLCGVFHTSASRDVYLNGGGKGSNTTPIVPADLTTTVIGRMPSSLGPTSEHTGLIAFPCIWNAALTDDEVASLADGLWPGLVRPESIVALWPLRGDATEIDVFGGYGMTPYNSPTVADNPRIYMPPRRRITYSVPTSVGLYRRIGLDGGMRDLTAGLRG